MRAKRITKTDGRSFTSVQMFHTHTPRQAGFSTKVRTVRWKWGWKEVKMRWQWKWDESYLTGARDGEHKKEEEEPRENTNTNTPGPERANPEKAREKKKRRPTETNQDQRRGGKDGRASTNLPQRKQGLRYVLYILTSKCAWRHTGVQFFISHLASWLRTRRFSEVNFRPSGAPNQRKKHSESWLSYLFAHLHLLASHFFSSLIVSLLDFSSLTLPTSAFPFLHIVGSLTSKLPSKNIPFSAFNPSKNFVFNPIQFRIDSHQIR